VENSSVELLRLAIDSDIDSVRLSGSYETGITFAYPVDRRFTNKEHGEVQSNTSRYLKRFLTRRRWSSVKVTASNRLRGSQVFVEVVIKDGFTPRDR
jgi:hypothetical protein